MFKERDAFFSEDEGSIIVNRDNNNLIKHSSSSAYFPSSATDSFLSSSSAPGRRNMKKKTSVSSLPSSSSGDDDPEGSSPFSINNNSSCCGSMGMNSSGEFGANCDRKYSPSSSFSYTNLSPSRNNNCNLDHSHQSHHHSISCTGGNVNNNNITCYGCDKTIYARYYVYAMNHHFHNECLKCHSCHSVLSDQRSCFERDGKILCKQDYYSLYHNHNNPATKHPPRCARCTNLIDPKDLVMRVCGLVYHVDCFVCTVCQRVLNRGDQFRMQSSDLYCSLHYEMIENFHTATTPGSPFKSEIITPSSKPMSNTSSPTSKRGRPPKRKLLSGVHDNMKDVEGSLEYFHSQANNGKPPPSISALSGMGAEFNQIMDSPLNGYGLGPVSHHGNDLGVSLNLNGEMHGQQQKGKRMRTTFKHNQLRIMKSYFDMNPNPDTKDLKQLSTKTGLCKRVLQVWFQNARAKHRRSCPRSESSLSGSGVLQLDDSQSQDWSPPSTFGPQAGVPIPSHPGGSLMQA